MGLVYLVQNLGLVSTLSSNAQVYDVAGPPVYIFVLILQ